VKSFFWQASQSRLHNFGIGSKSFSLDYLKTRR